MPINSQFHRQLPMLDLHICRLSSTVTAAEAFRRRCQREWPIQETRLLLKTSTRLDGGSSLFGVSLDPLLASLAEVAEFFNFLFEEEDLSPMTIDGYRAAINLVWEQVSDRSLAGQRPID